MDSVIDVKLHAFEGPLDLLLHLIEKNKIDIYDIPIAEITDQYMDYVRQLEEEDPDTASRFLVMAATLLAIKSEMLLPGSEDEGEDDEDPRQALIEQLMTYRIYKEAAQRLSEMEMPGTQALCRDSYFPPQVRNAADPVDVDAVLNPVTLKRLSQIFDEVMKRREESMDPVRSKFRRIRQERFTLADRINLVKDYFRDKEQISFRDLIDGTGGGRRGMIMTFLSVLELAKDGFLHLKAARGSSDITLTRRKND